jgi:hypothetical protein
MRVNFSHFLRSWCQFCFPVKTGSRRTKGTHPGPVPGSVRFICPKLTLAGLVPMLETRVERALEFATRLKTEDGLAVAGDLIEQQLRAL